MYNTSHPWDEIRIHAEPGQATGKAHPMLQGGWALAIHAACPAAASLPAFTCRQSALACQAVEKSLKRCLGKAQNPGGKWRGSSVFHPVTLGVFGAWLVISRGIGRILCTVPRLPLLPQLWGLHALPRICTQGTSSTFTRWSRACPHGISAQLSSLACLGDAV